MTDPQSSSPTPSESDLHASNGEVVRRVDLKRAANLPYLITDPPYRTTELAKAALAGDRAALDEFHEREGLALPDVTEYREGDAVRLLLGEVGRDQPRALFQATNEGGRNDTNIDAAELVAWILSADGRAALARRGVVVPSSSLEVPTPRKVYVLVHEPFHDNSTILGTFLSLEGAQRAGEKAAGAVVRPDATGRTWLHADESLYNGHAPYASHFEAQLCVDKNDHDYLIYSLPIDAFEAP